MKSLVGKSLGAAKSLVRYPELSGLAGRNFSARKIGVVYGNCQAEPIRQVLQASAGRDVKFVRVPPVHLITPRELRFLVKLAGSVDMFVYQPVRSEYRSLGVGTADLIGMLRPDAVPVSFPVLYYRGLHPYQVYVRDARGMNVAAPICAYHDLRFLAAMIHGYDEQTGFSWISKFRTSTEGLKGNAVSSLAELRQREAGLSVAVSSSIRTDDPHSFFSVNHPSNSLLVDTAGKIAGNLGLTPSQRSFSKEFLGDERSHVDQFIHEALGTGSLVTNAHFKGMDYSLKDLWSASYNWYRSNPDVVGLAERAHGSLLAKLELI